MVNQNKDFQKFLKSKKVDESYVKYYSKFFHDDFGVDTLPIDIFNRLLKDRIVLLSGEVETYNCELIKANLLYLESLSDDDITMYVNSPGGSVYDGLGLLDIMEYIKPDVSTVNTGLAASMGAIILCSGAKGKRKSLKRSRVMIHQPLGAAFGYQQASDMEIEAREVNELKKELYQIISNQTGQKYDKVYKDGDRNYWMNAKQAKDYGIVDEILIKRK
jgi:ATP-dependent Clp protease protease subunit